MKKFTAAEIRGLLNQVYHEEISFSRMVEILNEMVSEAEEPVRKFQNGDKVRIKDGVSSWSHRGQHPCFAREMDDLIGKTMTIELYCDRDIVLCEKLHWQFKEDWLEPYTDELKKGDLAIFWDDNKRYASIRFYERLIGGEEDYFQHKDQNGFSWINAIKFESKEQYERLIKGEI